MSDYSNQNSQNFSQSSAFAAALQRAKQIAAKIHPGGQQQHPVKRSLDDHDSGPESKKFGGQSDYNANSPTGISPAAMQAAAQAAAVAARLSQNNNNSNANSNSGGAPDPIQRVHELISKMVNQGNHSMDNGNGHQSGGARGGFGSSNNFNNQPFQEIMIPGAKVGLIIGKGGETIKQLQEKTGAKMVIIQDGPGQEMEKPLRISGDPQKVEHAKQLVYELIQEKDTYTQRQSMNGAEQVEVFVPKAAVGVVIGKGGDMIKKIQGESGCKLQFIQTRGDGPGDRRCIVLGSKQQVEDGKRMIEDLIESVMRREQGGGGGGGGGRGEGGHGRGAGGANQDGNFNNYSGPQVTREEYTFTVPVSKCGIIIGRGGDTIKQINQQSSAHTEMDRKASANQLNEKTFTCKGEPHQVEEAKRLIQEKINMDIHMVYVGSTTVPAAQYQNNGAGGGGGAGAGGAGGAGAGGGPNAFQQGWGYQSQSWEQQQQAQVTAAASAVAAQRQQQPQPDYSMEWIAYYKRMGMHREAEAIELQVKERQAAQGATAANQNVQGQTAMATANAGAQQVGGQADYSAEWAEYYRRIGKIDEAEAIEKQIAANKALQAQAAASQSNAGPGQQFNAGGNPQQQMQSAAQQQQQQQQQQQGGPGGVYGTQQYQQYYAGAAGAGGQPGYAGYPYGGGYPGPQGGGPNQPNAPNQDKN